MTTLDLQEQEQIAEFKAWWRSWGRYWAILLVAALLAFGGWKAWQFWSEKQAQKAAILFTQLEQLDFANQKARSASEVAHQAKTTAEELEKKFPSSAYAARAALIAAQRVYLEGDLTSAQTHLEWAVAHAGEPFVRDVARQRLAQVFSDQKKYDEGLKLLVKPESEQLAGFFAETRGDILSLKGDAFGARAAYKIALAQAVKDSSQFKLLKIKLDAQGNQ